jgi:hypothetical protein
MGLHAEPLQTAEADVPQEWLDRLSLSCRGVECLERAYAGWMRHWDDRRPVADARVELELYLWYGAGLLAPRRHVVGGVEGDMLLIDTPDVWAAGFPDLEVSCDAGPAPDAVIARRWLRVF